MNLIWLVKQSYNTAYSVQLTGNSKKMKRLSAVSCRLLAFLVCLTFCQVSKAQDTGRDTLPGFQFDILSFQTSSFSADSARVDVFVAVPYSWLMFLNATEKYVADYEVTVTIFEKTGSTVRSRLQPLSATLATAEWEKLHELDLTRADASQYSFTLKQGSEYNARIEIKDLSTHKELIASRSFTVLKFPRDTASISDILLYKSKEGAHILPHIGTDISSLKIDEAGLFCELYNAPQSAPFWLTQRISTTDDGEEIARNTSIFISTGQKRIPIFLPFIQEDLWSGKYQLELYMLTDGKDSVLTTSAELQAHALASRSRQLVVSGVHGVPLANLDLDDAIQQLAYIATGDAYDSLFHARTKQAKRKAIMDFWDKMNWYKGERTTKPMEAFYRRVQYANDHFKGVAQGWRSDRGKVYIMLGAPTSIDRYAYDVSNRPYEIWRYYDLNLQYYFTDQFMMGDYRLASVTPPPGTFLWQRESY